jgi:hypothetical protein
MALYYGLPFGIYALMLIVKDSIKTSDNFGRKLTQVFVKVSILIFVFLGTFFALYSPFIYRQGIAGVQ